MENHVFTQKAPEADRDHDLLSFLSVIFHEYAAFDLNYTLLGVVLNESSFDMLSVGAGGAYFSVYKASGKSLLERRIFSPIFPGTKDSFPELVAIKAPIIKGDTNSKKNRKIWTALAQEVMILRHPHLTDHENVVSLLGVCWHQSSTEGISIMPALVLEAAETDLEGFIVPGKGIERRKVICLAIDIVAGIRAVHDCGISHCDIKPKNILICKHQELGYTAKVADFGCAILLSTIKDKVMPPGGTEFWQAPECSQPLSGEGLKQADMYSTGLIVWNLLSANLAVTALKEANVQGNLLDDDSNVSDEGKARQTLLYVLIRESINDIWDLPADHYEFGTEIEAPRKRDIEYLLMSVVCLPPELRATAKEFLSDLRILLHQLLKYQVFAEIGDLSNEQGWSKEHGRFTDFNPQERDIWLNPGIEEPTDEDRERIMNFSKCKAWMDETIAAIKSSRSFKVKDLASYKVTNPEKYIGTTLKRWEMARQPAPNPQREVRNSLAVLEATHSFGTMRMTPPRVVDLVYEQLELVALNTKEPAARRAEAAYQYAMLSIGRLQIDVDTSTQIKKSLEMSRLAASLGHIDAQSMTSSFCQALQKGKSNENAEVELNWLKRGVKNGSLAAKRRLQNLDSELFLDAKNALRNRYTGVGAKVPWQYKYASDEDYQRMLTMALAPDSQHKKSDIFLTFITLGRIREFEQLIGKVDINSTNEWQETPLLVACRVGSAHMAGMLLDKGADPNIASDEGVVPLHFLAAYDEGDIQPVALRLVEKGAQLEMRSTHANRYRQTYDATFGQENGTPLLWAVAADNILATKVLVDLGADPFDLLGRKAPRSNRFGSLTWTSPVVYAATKHQYYLLDIMLAQKNMSVWENVKSMWVPSTRQKLNDNKRNFGTRGAVDDSSPLIFCVTYAAEGLTKRLLFHGDEHEIAFVKTFEVLIRAGVDPFSGRRNETDLLDAAVMYGQPFVINYLISWNACLLRPNPEQWLYLVKLAMSLSDHLVFKTLLQYSQAEKLEGASVTSLFAFIAANTDDIRFLDPFKGLRDPSQDFRKLFQLALYHGNYTVMDWFYKSGRCDIAMQEDDISVLGRLITGSKTVNSRLSNIEALVNMENLPDNVFYNCLNMYNSQLTALQVAVLHFEYWEGKQPAEWSVHMIVSRWSEPMYLNYQIPDGRYKGCTALHLAVQHTNVAAVEYLLNEEAESLDLSILDGRGLTVLDTALLLLKDQKKDMDFWELPLEKQQAADELHWSNTLMIICSLSEAGAKPSKLISAWVRPEPDVLAIFNAYPLKESTFPLVPIIMKNARDFFEMPAAEIEKLQPPMRAAARLAVNQAVFVATEESAPAQIPKTATDYMVLRPGISIQNPESQSPSTISQLEVEEHDNTQSLRSLVEVLQLEDKNGEDADTAGKGKQRAD